MVLVEVPVKEMVPIYTSFSHGLLGYTETNIQLALQQAEGHDIEYKSSAFWQLLLQHEFPLSYNYAVLCEQAPDRQDSRKRVDISVVRYDAEHHTFSPSFLLEGKRTGQGKSEIRPLEKQALARAKEAIATQNLMSIYVITTWGVRFRAWIVIAKDLALEPMHGGYETIGTLHDYIHVASEDSRELARVFDIIKTKVPLRQPAVVPSQAEPSTAPWPMRTEQGPTAAEPGPSNYPMNYSSQIMQNATESVDDYDYVAGSSAPMQKDSMEVKVTVVSHTWSKDEWVFTNVRGHRKAVVGDSWKRVRVDGRLAWEYEGTRCTYYYTYQKLSNP